MKHFEITYYLRPEAENVVIIIAANSYRDACTFAKAYRRESFGVKELLRAEGV